MTTFLYILASAILVYFVAFCVINLLLILLGTTKIHDYNCQVAEGDFDHITKSRVSLPISLIIPAYNEQSIIVDSVLNTLKLDYPVHEVVVVDDGSTDETLSRLVDRFNLKPVESHRSSHIQTNELRAVYESADHPKLMVISKKNGRRADAINVGVNHSRYPLICVIDADCVLERDGLQHMARPFLFDPDLAAAGGVVRPSNGLTMEDGVITGRSLPHTLLGLNQEVEYARSFQWARIGLNRLHSMLCISGALLLVKRSVIEKTGGPWHKAITDDVEYTMRLHRFIFDRKARLERKCRIAFIPDAVSYTEVPEKFRLYCDQRNRWQRGTLQAIWRNRRMLFNPRYGITGLLGMPYFLIFEALAPLVEFAAYASAITMLIMGLATWQQLLALVFVAYASCILLTLTAVLITETSRFRSTTWREYWKMILSVLLDNFGFHQIRVLTSVWATLQLLIFRRRDLGMQMARVQHSTALQP